MIFIIGIPLFILLIGLTGLDGQLAGCGTCACRGCVSGYQGGGGSSGGRQ